MSRCTLTLPTPEFPISKTEHHQNLPFNKITSNFHGITNLTQHRQYAFSHRLLIRPRSVHRRSSVRLHFVRFFATLANSDSHRSPSSVVAAPSTSSTPAPSESHASSTTSAAPSISTGTESASSSTAKPSGKNAAGALNVGDAGSMAALVLGVAAWLV